MTTPSQIAKLDEQWKSAGALFALGVPFVPRPAPDALAIRGIKPRRESKSLASRPSRKPRKHANMQRKAFTPTYEQLAQEILFLRSHVAALVTENEAMKALLPVAHKQEKLAVMRLKSDEEAA